MRIDSFPILGTKIHAVQIESALGFVLDTIDKKQGYKYIVSSNANNVINAVESTKYKDVMSQAYLSLPDGVPFLWEGRKRGFDLPERCGIQELMEALFEMSNTNDSYTHFFYGNTQEVLDKMIKKLNIKYPKLKVIGSLSPPFRKLSRDEDKAIIEIINKKKPDFLWVSLGCPKQEEWMYDHAKDLDSMIAGGAGAVFNFIAGETKRAPKWVQSSGLEWFYRLLLNPKKLANRYLIKYPKFMYLYFKEKLIQKGFLK